MSRPPGQLPQAPAKDGIGTVLIDPGAEPNTQLPATVSAQQEVEFYKQTAAQYQLLHDQQTLGYLGKFFGASSAAPTNIAGLVALCSFLVVVVSVFLPANPELTETRKWMIGLITTALGFIFGAASKK